MFLLPSIQSLKCNDPETDQMGRELGTERLVRFLFKFNPIKNLTTIGDTLLFPTCRNGLNFGGPHVTTRSRSCLNSEV